MLETGRRSAISTSELGLYSDRGDRYNRSRYGLIVRKLAIGVMVVVTVILVSNREQTLLIIYYTIVVRKYLRIQLKLTIEIHN